MGVGGGVVGELPGSRAFSQGGAGQSQSLRKVNPIIRILNPRHLIRKFYTLNPEP